MADKTILEGLKLIEALDLLVEVGICRRNNRMVETKGKKRIVVQIGMYFITLMLLLLLQIMCRYRRRQGRNTGSQAFAK
jgi:hypothetical protein